MNIKQEYKELVDRSKALHNDKEQFIINVIKQYGGRVTIDVSEEDLVCMCLDEIYPTKTTVWGRHGDYDIYITSVHINSEYGKDTILIDGTDTEDHYQSLNSNAYTWHYADIMSFLYHVLDLKLEEYAEE